MTHLAVMPYQEQVRKWPTRGRHILAQFDDDSFVVYQAYKPAIGHFAAANGNEVTCIVTIGESFSGNSLNGSQGRF